MRKIPFRILPKDRLLPLEEFLYQLYRFQLSTLPDEEHRPAPLQELCLKYPELAEALPDFLTNIQLVDQCSEGRYMDEELDIAVYTHLRYFPKKIHSHQFFELLYISEGHCVNRFENTSIALEKGDVCFIAPDVPHQVQVYNHETIVYNILVRTSTFQEAFNNIYGRNDIVAMFFKQNLYRQSAGASPYMLCKTDSEPILLELIQRIIAEEQGKELFCNEYMKLLFNTFLLELLRRHEQHFTVAKSEDNIEPGNIPAILRYIQSNYQTVTLAEAAHFFNYSEAHLSRIIKKYSGQTFSDIIKTIRLQKSVELLESTDLSITEIAEQMGYTDNSHFHKVFKHAYGLTPIQYRQKYLAEQNEHG
ncbi:MAG: AraC family transcriptional regulator [Oscillospiraceae bacterium]